MAKLLDLPPELICLILGEIRSVHHLYLFLRASSYVYRAFISSKDLILWNVERRSIAPSVVIDALIAIKLQQAKCTISELWSEYEEIRELTKEKLLNNGIKITEPQGWISSADLTTLSQVQSTIEYFIDDFSSRKLRTLHHTADGTAMPMADLERARLQRAFYRYNACHMLANYPGRLHVHWHLQQPSWSGLLHCLNSLLGQFAPWEVEEIVCVHQYLRQRIQEIFDVLGDELMNSIMANPVNGQAATTLADRKETIMVSRFEAARDDYCFSEAGKWAQQQMINYLAGRTLPFLRALFESEVHTQRRLVLTGFAFGSDLLSKILGRTGLREGTVGNDGQHREYEGDKLTNYNLAWQWSRYTYLPPHRCSSCVFNLREWGYVIWDQDRIKQSGLIDEPGPQQVQRQCPPRRDRHREPSIQRKLQGMDLPEGWDLVLLERDD